MIGAFNWLFHQSWPLVTLGMCCIALFVSVAGVLGRRWYPRAFRCLCLILCLVSVYVIIGYALFWRGEKARELILIPFNFLINRATNPAQNRPMLMNIFFFMPLGMTLVFSLAEKVRHKILWCVLCGMLLSCFIEGMQFLFSRGRSEVDDVLMNTLGTWAGAMTFTLAWLDEWLRKRRGGLKNLEKTSDRGRSEE